MSDLQSKTDEELNRQLAEMIGWKIFEWGVQKPGDAKPTGRGYKSVDELLPRYCTDLNAVAKVEAGLTDEQFQQFSDALWRLIVSQGAFPYSKRYRQLVTATARQRTIALIQTLTP